MHITPKKRLGQNFLVDKNMQRKIISACGLQVSESVLEIGAGRGEMTGLLAAGSKEVYALEIDHRLYALLGQKYKNASGLTILHQDILQFDIARFCRAKAITKLKVIGNIPYYITTPIIEHLLEHRSCIDTIFLTVQKEFGRRIASGPGTKDYGSFSCFVHYYAQPEILCVIPRTCFKPQPKVDSCFLKLTLRPQPRVQVKDEQYLFSVIRTAFNQRRKTLKNSLCDVIPASIMDEFFNRYGINRSIRAEMLSLEDFAHLVGLQ